MVAAAFRRLLQRRPAGSPSLALLRPLFSGPPSNPPSPLLAAAAVARLATVRRSQFSPGPAPSLLRLYSSKGYGLPPPQQPTGCKGTPSLKQSEQYNSTLSHAETLFLTGLLMDMQKHFEIVNEGYDTCEKASRLLEEGFDDKAFATFEKGFGDLLKAFTVYEKRMDDYAKAVERCNELPPSSQEKIKMLCKEMKENSKIMRQKVENLSGKVETMKILKQHSKGVLRSVSDDILRMLRDGIFAVGHGACLLLLLTSIWIYLLRKFI